jgi:hypothetical protein
MAWLSAAFLWEQQKTQNSFLEIVDTLSLSAYVFWFVGFVCYSNRYTLAVGSKRLSYTTSFKLQVFQYAEKHGRRSAGCKFSVN